MQLLRERRPGRNAQVREEPAQLVGLRRAELAPPGHARAPTDPLLRRGRSQHAPAQDAISARDFHRLALHADFFRPLKIEHQLTLGLLGPPGRLVGIPLNRAREDFSDDELLVAELLRPRLQAAELAATHARAVAVLTHREREVLDLVVTGATNAAVAEALVVSPATVKKHLDKIYAKLDVSSRTAAVARARHASSNLQPL